MSLFVFGVIIINTLGTTQDLVVVQWLRKCLVPINCGLQLHQTLWKWEGRETKGHHGGDNMIDRFRQTERRMNSSWGIVWVEVGKAVCVLADGEDGASDDHFTFWWFTWNSPSVLHDWTSTWSKDTEHTLGSAGGDTTQEHSAGACVLMWGGFTFFICIFVWLGWDNKPVQ